MITYHGTRRSRSDRLLVLLAVLRVADLVVIVISFAHCDCGALILRKDHQFSRFLVNFQ